MNYPDKPWKLYSEGPFLWSYTYLKKVNSPFPPLGLKKVFGQVHLANCYYPSKEEAETAMKNSKIDYRNWLLTFQGLLQQCLDFVKMQSDAFSKNSFLKDPDNIGKVYKEEKYGLYKYYLVWKEYGRKNIYVSKHGYSSRSAAAKLFENYTHRILNDTLTHNELAVWHSRVSMSAVKLLQSAKATLPKLRSKRKAK